MPQTTSPTQDIINIANQLCGIGDGAVHPPPSGIEPVASPHRLSPEDSDELMKQLLICLNEAIDKATETQEAMNQWKLMFPPRNLESVRQEVAKTLQIPREEYNTLDAEESSRLHILIQMSSFACFLKKQENDAAYMDKSVHIKELDFKILEIGRILRKLISLGDENIKNYVVRGNATSTLTIDTFLPISKRVACYTVVELLLNTLETITMSETTSSVVMS